LTVKFEADPALLFKLPVRLGRGGIAEPGTQAGYVYTSVFEALNALGEAKAALLRLFEGADGFASAALSATAGSAYTGRALYVLAE